MSDVTRRRNERGMTLVEALLAVVLTGLITAAIGGALMVTIGPDQQAADRLASAHDAQLVALYLPDDVQSASTVDLAETVSPPCSGTEPGTNELMLSWTQAVPTSTTYNVSYRVRTVGDERQLVRFSCQGTGAAAEIVVAHDLDDDFDEDLDPAPAVDVTSVGRRITARLRSTDGVVMTISGLRRTPSTECTVTSHALSASTVYVSGGTLSETVTMTVTTQGPCTGLTLVIDGGMPDQAFSSPTGTSTATLPSSGWSIGTYNLDVIDASTGADVLAEETLFVEAPPCVATLTLAPNPVALGSATTLASDVTVLVGTSAECTNPLELAYTTPGDNADHIVPVVAGTATISRSDGQWAAGDVEIVAREVTPDADVVGSETLTVTAFVPCVVSSVTANPATLARTASKDLSQPVTITAATTGTCGALEATYQRSSADPVQILPLGSGPYTGAIPVAGPWDIGAPAANRSFTVSVRQVGTTTVLQTGSFTVTPAACSVGTVVPNPSSVPRVPYPGQGNVNGPRELSQSVLVTVTTTGDCTGLRLRFTPTNNPSTQTVSLVPNATYDSWTYTIPGTGATGAVAWSLEIHPLSVVSATAITPVLSTGNLTVT